VVRNRVVPKTLVAAVVFCGQLTGCGVVSGAAPQVRACSDYRDFIGHLTAEGASAVAISIGQRYANQ
jgi:hypothetical protein